MGYKKPSQVSQKQLISYPLPTHGKKYKVVSHKFVLEQTIKKLRDSNFTITNQFYRATKEGKVAQGILHITPNIGVNQNYLDNNLGLMFGWSNSYDKSTRFQCAIGAYVMVCSNGMVGGELSYSRKHIGKADYDILNQIHNQINKAKTTYTNLINDKNELIGHILTDKEQAELAGRLFFEEELISPNQLNIIKTEMKKPSFDYSVDNNNAWSFYNHVTHAMKQTHPKKWMSDQKKFHDFMTAEFKCNTYLSKKDTALNSRDKVLEALPDLDDFEVI